MKTKNKMLAMLAGSVMLACGMAHGAPWNEDDVVMTDGDTVLAPTTFENVSLSFDGEAAADGDVVAVFRDDGVFCGYGEVYRSNLEIVVYAAKDEPLSLKVWRHGTPDTAVLEVNKISVGGSEAGQLLAPNPGDVVSGGEAAGLSLAYEPEPETHTLSFNAAGGSAVASITQASGTAVTAPAAPTRAGYTFAGWTPGLPATMPEEDMTLTAQWTVNQYTVAFDANGGTGGGSAKQDYGSAITAPEVTRTGYTFAGWSPAVAATVPASDVTYTAQWTPNQYTVTFDANGGTGGRSAKQDYGSAIAAPAVARTGYTLTGWSPALAATVPASDVKYTAQWKVNQYTVAFDANGGEGGKSAKQDYGSAITAPAVTRTGYTFLGWSPAVAATVPASDVTYKAQWKVEQRTVTVDGTAVTVDYGTRVGDIPSPTQSGYAFDGWWTAADGGERVSDDTAITGGMSLYAHWTQVRPQLWDDVEGAAPTAAASTYDGYLCDAAGNVKGTLQVKVGKPSKKTGLAAVKATLIKQDGKKVQLKAAEKGKALIAADGPTAVELAGGDACEVTLGARGMSGTYGNYTVDGSLNVFASKDAAAKAAASAALGAWKGPVNVAWRDAEAAPYQTLTVSIAAKGKAKVSGTLANGAKVTANGQLAVGGELCCVPVVVSKKGRVAFNVWLPLNGQAARSPSVAGLADAVVGKPGKLKAGAVFKLGGAVGGAKFGDYLPDGLAVGGGSKWSLPKAGKVVYAKGTTNVDESKLGENPSALKLTNKAKDGTFKGSFKAYTDVNGKPKGAMVNVTGVLVDGVGYGAATIKGGGSVPVTIDSAE